MRKVFIVEDEAIVAMELKDQLRSLGYEVCGHAFRAPAALAQIPQARPDLVLMDVNLGNGISGLDVAASLRLQLDIPIIFLTAYSDAEIADRAAQTGSFSYMVKPFLPRVLRANIEMALARHDAEAHRKALEARLYQAQKMEALGMLAGGIAHDFNNLLAIIATHAELARQSIDPSHPASESLNAISLVSTRATSLVRQILTFTRNQTPNRTLAPLVPLIEEATGLLRASIPPHIHISTSLPYEGSPAALIDPTQIHQVLMNLCTNARQSIRNPDGLIKVTLDTVAFPEHLDQLPETQKTKPLCDLPPGTYARLRVCDNGVGIQDTDLPLIFEPFFTTKAAGEGTGLGLALVYQIVANHNGAVSVHSILGRGTTFSVYLPATCSPAPHSPPQPPQNTPKPAQHSQILYIDDEALLIQSVKRIIHNKGYLVSGFTCASEAITAVRLDPTRFCAVLLDYNMPEMSGMDAAKQLRQIAPSLPIIVISGYLKDQVVSELVSMNIQHFIEKPFRTDQLLSALESALSALGR